MNTDTNAAQSFPETTFDGSVFFYCCDNSFPHLSICLAEGLKELGIPFYANINYWQITPDRSETLFRNDPSVSPDDCSVVVLDKEWLVYNPDVPENLFHRERKYISVYLDDMDGPKPSVGGELNFDFVFRTHCDSTTTYPANFKPWVFGLSNRILRETHIIPNFSERRRHLIVNFRNDQEILGVNNWWLLKVDQGLLRIERALLKADYPLRKMVRQQFFPLIQDILPVDDAVDSFEEPPSDSYHYLQWSQTGGRHHPNYYQRLKESFACAAFAGWMVPGAAPGEQFVQWWDCWRFWESLAAGCVTFHVDFEKYGIILPVMPENWRHYIGIDLENVQEAVERIADDPGILERISAAGRRWAIENYGPVPTTLRFLETIFSNGLQVSRGPDNQGLQVNFSLSSQLKEINLIIFPDWSVPEEPLALQLQAVIRALVTHPDRSFMTLLIDTSNVSEENANLLLSSVTMNLLWSEDLEVTEGPEISLIGNISESQWAALLPRIQARIVLENENQEAIAAAVAENLFDCELDSFSSKRAVQLETGVWEFR